jgi:uncharacterized protein YfiM (DUF2279 family)
MAADKNQGLRIYIFLFTFLPVCLEAQILQTDNPWLARDKMLHFSYSAGFTPATIQILELKNVKHPEIKGAALIFGVGLAKEFLIDNKPRYQDITINFAGCVAGIFLNRLINKTYQKNHEKKQKIPYQFNQP